MKFPLPSLLATHTRQGSRSRRMPLYLAATLATLVACGFACDPGAKPASTCRATKLHRTTYGCNGTQKSSEQVIDLVATGYSNYKCANRFKE
jgi:hypothetical protein